MRPRRATLVALTVLVAAWASPTSASTSRVESAHFVIECDSAVSSAYAELVQRGLESAYDLFVTQASFPTFTDQVLVRIVDGLDGMGAEYLDEDEEGNVFPIIEIASRKTMAEAADEMLLGLSLEDAVLSTTAHEVFHVLQDYAALRGLADIEEAAFVEPLATAAQELAAPQANDYLDAAIDFLDAPDGGAFLDRGYDGGIFWVFALDRYGVDLVRRVMAASVAADGAEAIDLALAPEGLTFLDLWAKFAAAWATDTLPDAAALQELARAWRADTGLVGLALPPIAATARWDGRVLVVDRDTEGGSALPLKLSYPYGIDAVAIAVESPHPFVVSIDASTITDVRIAVVGRRGDALELLSLSSARAVAVSNPDRYAEIRVVLTRGERGSGAYAVRLTPGS